MDRSIKLIAAAIVIGALVVLALLLTSCNAFESSSDPGTTIAGFSVSYADSWSIQVADQSVNARSWLYDFGDASGRSIERNPSHDYQASASIRGCTTDNPCNYTITQTACRGDDGNYDSLDCERSSARVVIPEPR